MTRVAFVMASPGQGWLGGLSYFRNLFQALRELPEPHIEPVILTHPHADANDLKSFQPIEILRTALDWRADVIVMGPHGRGRVARFLLGSVAEEVIRRAACPVVTVAHEPAQAMWQVDDASTAARDLATACV